MVKISLPLKLTEIRFWYATFEVIVRFNDEIASIGIGNSDPCCESMYHQVEKEEGVTPLQLLFIELRSMKANQFYDMGSMFKDIRRVVFEQL